MPGLSLDRLRSERSDVPILRWLGPWRFSAHLARAGEFVPTSTNPCSWACACRSSLRSPRVRPVAHRAVLREGRPCNAKTFWNVLAGNDNAGLRVSAAEEPETRWRGSTCGSCRRSRRCRSRSTVSSSARTTRATAFPSGTSDSWVSKVGICSGPGSTVRWHLEYANTNCKFTNPTVDLAGFSNCAYRQGIFRAGYRFHGRNIGHTTDADSESVSIALTLRTATERSGASIRDARCSIVTVEWTSAIR